MKKTANFLLLLVVSASAVLGEKPIRGRPFSRPIFQRQEEAPAAQAPYQPSGWKPSGQQLILPARQEAGVPHTVYGPPSTEAPPSEYGPPEQTDAPQYPPNEYGPPDQEPQEPNNAYGPPDQEPLEPQQPEAYPPAGGPPGESTNGGYDYPPPQQPFPDPGNEYGPPAQPDNEYGPPQPATEEPGNEYGAPPQQPGNEYGAPPQNPDNGYGAPPQETGQIPVEQGASERLRQQQFVQQLPGFAPSRFVKPRSQRIRQNPRGNAAPQKLQQLPQRSQKQQFRQQANRRPQQSQNVQQFQSQRAQPQRQQQFQRQQQRPIAQNQQFAQKQQLYQTPQSAAENPNVAIATAVSGEYYIIEPNGRLQRVSYTTMNGKLVDGKITSGLKPDDVQNTNSPIYQINEFNQLVRVNLRSSQ